MYRATDSKTGNDVALKVVNLQDKITKSEKVLRQEIDILREIDYPGIIRMFTSFESKDSLY